MFRIILPSDSTTVKSAPYKAYTSIEASGCENLNRLVDIRQMPDLILQSECGSSPQVQHDPVQYGLVNGMILGH